MMEMDKSILDDFVTEAKEHLETVEEVVLRLEKESGSIGFIEAVNLIFRVVHSIKGTAGFVGLTKLQAVAHAAETLLSMLRAGELTLKPGLVDALLAAIDSIRSMIDDVENSNSHQITEVVNRLDAFIAGTAASSAPAAPVAAVSTPQQAQLSGLVTGILKRFNLRMMDLLTYCKGNGRVYLLNITMGEGGNTRHTSAVKLVKELQEFGNVLAAHLDSTNAEMVRLHDTTLFYEVLYTSMIQPENLARELNLPAEHVHLLTKEMLITNGGEPEADNVARSILEEVKVAEEKRETQIAGDAAGAEEQITQSTAETPVKNVDASQEKVATVDRRQETIRIKLSILDELMQLAGELVLVRNQQLLSEDRSNPNSRAGIQRLDIVTSDLQETIMATRMQPIGNLFNRFTRVVRDLGGKLGKQIELEITGADVELDNTILEALTDPMTHLVRNSCDHGIELPADRVKAGKKEIGKVSLHAYHRSGQINIEMRDDGKGINPAVVRRKALEKGLKTEAELAEMSEKEIISLILLPGFSTAEKISDVSGRGVGMDVVKTGIQQLGGTLDIESHVGKGSTVHMQLPLTLAIIPCLIVMVGKYRYAIPQVNLEELVCLYDKDVATKIECAGDTEVYRLRDKLLPIVRLDEVMKRPKPFTILDRSAITEENRKRQEDYLVQLAGKNVEGTAQMPHSLNFIVVQVANNSFGLVVDKVIGTEEIVVKPMHPSVKTLGCYAGSTVMGDGRVALILDVQGVARHAGISFESSKEAAQDRAGLRATDMQRALLFKSGPTEQLAIPLSLIKRIEAIKTENLENIGGREYITIEGQSTLVLRLDQQLPVSPAVDKKEMFLIIPRVARHPFGVLVSQLLDTMETSVELNTDSYVEEGLLGTAIIKDKMTLFLDIDTLIRKAEPSWFAPGSGGKILLVEDSPFYRRLVKKYLEADGYDVAMAENGQDGLAQLANREFDLVISDIQMPVMDGLTFMKNLRAGNRQPSIPAIALTALNNERDRTSAKNAGFNHYELKMSRDQLLSSVAALMECGAGNGN